MMNNYIPVKPFPEYKWRWATLTPTESLNRPSIFLGVLRALQQHSGEPPSSKGLYKTLQAVEADMTENVTLAKDPKRNLLRNSGQYWKSLGVLDKDMRGSIKITDFGQKVGDGSVTQVEFALTVVESLTLPNSNIEKPEVVGLWESHNLKIKPLKLILELISHLHSLHSVGAFITANELIKIVIPLSGSGYSSEKIAQAIVEFRQDSLDIGGWSDCCPEANDRRMAREFLLFLEYYHLIKKVSDQGISAYDERYELDCISLDEVAGLDSIDDSKNQIDILQELTIEGVPLSIERKRVSRDILERPNQKGFRKDVLEAYTGRCLITGVDVHNVLEAAHIIPVSENGSDYVSNGICLRVDVHRLYDTGHLRIDSSGKLSLSESAAQNQNYGLLPKQVDIPPFVNPRCLDFRRNYL